MKRKLVFWTAFNSYQSSKLLRNKPVGTQHPTTTDEWIQKRIKLFKEYNLPSILQQKYDDFHYIVLLDPLSKKQIDPLLPRIDDRVVYVYEDGAGLEVIKQYDEIVYTLIDSDDMYSVDAGIELMNPGNKEWSYFKYGICYDYLGDNIWSYDTIGTGPFFSHRFDPKDMKNFDREKRHPTHVAVLKLNPGLLPENNFCVLIHDINTSSHSNMRYILKEKLVDMDMVHRKFGNLLED